MPTFKILTFPLLNLLKIFFILSDTNAFCLEPAGPHARLGYVPRENIQIHPRSIGGEQVSIRMFPNAQILKKTLRDGCQNVNLYISKSFQKGIGQNCGDAQFLSDPGAPGVRSMGH